MNIFSQFRIVKIFKILLTLNTCLELLLIFFSIVENGNSMQMNAGSMQTDWLHTNTQQNNDQNTGPPKKLQKECVFFLFFCFGPIYVTWDYALQYGMNCIILVFVTRDTFSIQNREQKKCWIELQFDYYLCFCLFVGIKSQHESMPCRWWKKWISSVYKLRRI